MDDLCQEGDRDAAGRGGRQIAEGLCKVEAMGGWKAGPLRALALNPDAEDEADDICREARKALKALLRGDAGSLANACEKLERVMRGVRRGMRCVASLDYNARNAVLDASGTVRLIDFSVVGWDWPERRFVQYVTGLGAYRNGGRLVSPLTPELASHYARVRRGFAPEADEEAVIRAVDAHDLLFHLVILARLARLRSCPETDGARLLRRAWDAPEARWRQAVRNLGRPLSDDPDASALREICGRQ
jgi:hypothetical protein